MYKKILALLILITNIITIENVFASCDSRETGFLTMSDGAKLYYEISGEGTPLLFIHGGDSNENGFLGLDSWEPQFCVFAENYRVIRYDMRHIGNSDKTGLHPIFEWFWTEVNIPHIATQDAAEILVQLGIDHANVVGLSIGSAIANQLILFYPKIVDKVVIASPWQGGTYPESSEYLTNLASHGSKTMLIGGWDDQQFQFYMNQSIDNQLNYARAIGINGAGHFANKDQSEQFNVEVRDFFNEGFSSNEEGPETPVAILSENLDIHIPVLHYQVNEAATANLDVYLSSAPSENGNLTWQLESYRNNICSNTQNSCLSEFEVATASSNETNSQNPFNIHIPAINFNANTYWANLGFIGSQNGNLAWQLQNFGVSNENITVNSQNTTSTSIFESNPQLINNTLLFGINVAATFTEQNLPELIQLSRDISTAKEAYWLVRSTLPDPGLVTLPSNPSQAINDALDAMSEIDDQIFKATQEIEAGKVVDGLGDTNLSRTFSRIATGLQVITSIYSTYDILEKTLNGKATTADKENYIINGTFSIFGLTQIISTPAVANGFVMKGAGFIGLGYAALQIGAAWGEHVNGITVTGTIEDSVNATLSQVENLDALARVIASGASVGRTWEEMKALESIQTIKNVTVNTGVTSIEALETPSAIASIISTGNTFYADNAKELILDTMNLVNSEQYSVDMYQKIYKAGRQAFFANRALEMLNEK